MQELSSAADADGVADVKLPKVLAAAVTLQDRYTTRSEARAGSRKKADFASGPFSNRGGRRGIPGRVKGKAPGCKGSGDVEQGNKGQRGQLPLNHSRLEPK